eukprot:gb/GFBE01064122.1/.p1 GENE.gb/GFBE01064122.1/~~gb/GFBE01064122.1/.p1  ORF type:complete len:173 (+),score=28.66 gb/GFBE01064122.1/:1-519(+)
MCTVGLLLTKSGVPCGTHGRRQRLGMDFRTKTTLNHEGNDKSSQHLHLSKKSLIHQSLVAGRSMPRSSSEPSVLSPELSSTVTLDAIVGTRRGRGQDEALSELPRYEPVWKVENKLPMISTVQFQNHRSNRDSMAATLAAMQEAVQGESLRDLERNSQWGFKRRPDGGFWMK